MELTVAATSHPARAASGVSGDLFQADDPAAKPTEPAKPLEGPIGLLN